MLTCMTCKCKQKVEDDGGEEGPSGTPNTKQSVKSLTAQIKDMALKISGAYRCKSSIHMKGQTAYPYPDFDVMSAGSSNATRAYVEDEEEPKEWIAHVEPGIQITFETLPRGGNDLRRIRFSREMFSKWQAQRWWSENYDRIMELYNVQRFNKQALSSEDGRDSNYSRHASARASQQYNGSGEMTSRATTSSRDEASICVSNASDIESEWIEEDEPGVFVTIRLLVDGTRELRRVRFSREKFGEVHAKQWWEQNRDRIQEQYL